MTPEEWQKLSVKDRAIAKKTGEHVDKAVEGMVKKVKGAGTSKDKKGDIEKDELTAWRSRRASRWRWWREEIEEREEKEVQKGKEGEEAQEGRERKRSISRRSCVTIHNACVELWWWLLRMVAYIIAFRIYMLPQWRRIPNTVGWICALGRRIYRAYGGSSVEVRERVQSHDWTDLSLHWTGHGRVRSREWTLSINALC